MLDVTNETLHNLINQKLPSFEETFATRSMTSVHHVLSAAEELSTSRKQHPKKSALKRHFEQEKVVVQPAQADRHIAKRLKSDWDLLFYNQDSALERNNVNYLNRGLGQFPKSDHHHESFTSKSKSKKRQSFLVRGKEMKTFFHLLEDDLIQDFLFMDSCMKISDKYLLAMVFAYFKRAGFKLRDYTRMNFFVALYLANDMEEDEEELKYEVFPWALGDKWRDKFPMFLIKRDKLWAKIDHRAVVSRRCCDEIMAIEPEHPIWTRTRPDYHGGAIRSYMKDPDDDGYPRGPNAIPRKCGECDTDSQYDSASPDSLSWYVSSGHSSPAYEDEDFFEKPNKSTFDMKGLKKMLPEDEWPTTEE